jgi:hypothetical protein
VNSNIPTDRQVYQSEIQKLNSHIGNLRTKLNSRRANQTVSAVPISPQASTTIRLIGIFQSTSQVSPGIHIYPGVNGVFATYLHETM